MSELGGSSRGTGGREVDALLAAGDAARAAGRALEALLGRVPDAARLPGEARDRLRDAIGAVGSDVGTEAPTHAPAEAGADGGGEGAGANGMFEGSVDLDVGPLTDFAQLVELEDAAGAIEATSEISIKRFSRGRATLGMRLSEPVELLRELEERCDLEFRVRSTKNDGVVLDVDEEE